MQIIDAGVKNLNVRGFEKGKMEESEHLIGKEKAECVRGEGKMCFGEVRGLKLGVGWKRRAIEGVSIRLWKYAKEPMHMQSWKMIAKFTVERMFEYTLWPRDEKNPETERMIFA